MKKHCSGKFSLGDTKSEIMVSDIFEDDQNKIVNNGVGIKVSMNRPDELVAIEKTIDLLKSMLKGFNCLFLKDTEILKNRVYLFESGETHFNIYNYSTSDLIKLFSGFGFKCYRVKDLDTLAPIKNDYSSV